MRFTLLFLPICAVAVGCTSPRDGAMSEDNYASYVDPKIGSGGHGHVFVGANVPFGMVQLGPTSIPQAWDWTSGYHDSDSTVIGFSHTHLSGTGIGDLFDITVMPVTGSVTYERGREDNPAAGLWSYADRSKEIARPGFYSVPLERYGILAELTATPRVGVHRYTFPASDSTGIVIDLRNGGCWDSPTDIMMVADGNRRIKGHRFSTGWAKDQKVYFVAEFSKPFREFTLEGENKAYGRAHFSTDSAESIVMKVAISPNSVEQAELNLDAEVRGWDFDSVSAAAEKIWNSELSKITVKGGDEKELKKFYTALYHTMIAPSIFSDAQANKNEYTTYSLWDTYRTEMPLLSIYQPERYADMVNTMIDLAEAEGRLPVWHLWGNETFCMVGDPGIPVVADAIVKRIQGVDTDRAFRAMIETASDTARGRGLRNVYGYIPCDLFNEAIAYDMEYAIADGAIANAAIALGDSATARIYGEKSHSYRNYFDRSTGFIRGLDSKREKRTPFDATSTSHRMDDYCEGNAWQYTWLAPHDIDGLAECFGSKEKMIAKLDSLFTVSSELSGDNASPDITGLIGQYAHGNEPGHHTAYIYTILGQPEKTARLVDYIRREMYTDRPDGLAGNEDVGQMSAWFVMSALGFYPVEPGSGRYVLGTPLFDEARIKVGEGEFVIRAERNKESDIVPKEVTINGRIVENGMISHSDIKAGGELVFKF